MSFLIQSSKNVYGYAQSHVCTASLISSLFANQCPFKTYLSGLKIYLDGVRLFVCWVREEL